MNKITIFFFTGLFLSCQIDKKEDNTLKTNSTSLSGKNIFAERCIACHGSDGTMGFGGAKDLTKSLLSEEEIILQVTNGKGAMAPYKNILSSEEINQVSKYVLSFRLK